MTKELKFEEVQPYDERIPEHIRIQAKRAHDSFTRTRKGIIAAGYSYLKQTILSDIKVHVYGNFESNVYWYKFTCLVFPVNPGYGDACDEAMLTRASAHPVSELDSTIPEFLRLDYSPSLKQDNVFVWSTYDVSGRIVEWRSETYPHMDQAAFYVLATDLMDRSKKNSTVCELNSLYDIHVKLKNRSS